MGDAGPATGATGARAGTPRLELRGITKRFPGVLANDAVDLSVAPGQIHALLGENGAGKSTLVKIIYGVLRPDAGAIVWEGRDADIHNPAQARAMGIGMVFQHFNLFETLTVTENIALGMDGATDLRRLAAEIRTVSERYGLPVDPKRHIHALSVGERQRVEIVRCLLQNPRLLIMDEPTSVLTPQEVDRLFGTLRRLAAEGCSILYISHKLDEIMALCEAVTVLRDGRLVANADPRNETAKSLAEMMIGSALPVCERGDSAAGVQPRLQVTNLSARSDDPFGTHLKSVSLTVYAGEVLGVAGVAGNGQSELLALLSGEKRVRTADAVKIDGRPVGNLGPTARRARGLAFVPEERLNRGAVAEMSLSDNTLLTGYDNDAGPGGFIRFDRIRERAERICRRFNVVSAGPGAEAKSLSGGNLQKFIIGREILLEPTLLIASHPTWGVDVGAAATIRQALIDMAEDGAAVLVVSEDLDELFEISNRITVIAGGRLSPARPIAETNVEEVGRWMAGMIDDAGGEGDQDAA